MSFQQATGYTTSFVTDAINAIVSLNNNKYVDIKVNLFVLFAEF